MPTGEPPLNTFEDRSQGFWLTSMANLAYCMLTGVWKEVIPVAVEALIIDDSPVARLIIRHHLEQIGCTIAGEAGNPAAGLDLFRKIKPSLVTLDLIMPTVDGVDTLQAFRIMRKENPSTRILVVSAVPFEKTRRTMTEEGALAYIAKPFNKFSFNKSRRRLLHAFPELAAALRRHLT